MIDPATGDVALDTGEVIGAALTRSALLASPLGAGIAPASYVELGRRPIGGETFVVALGFDGEALRTVTLTMVRADSSASWDDWSADAELARKARHDAWLERSLGALPWWFGWGEVASEYDPQAGSSSVRIRYGGYSRPSSTITLDPASGDLVLGTGGRLGPGLTRTSFLSSTLAGGAGQGGQTTAPRAAFPLELRLPGGDAAALHLHFEGPTLRMVVMQMIDHHEPPVADYLRVWGDDQALARLLRANEQARKTRHDAWLFAQLGPAPWSHRWGTADSQLDATFCASQILVTYR